MAKPLNSQLSILKGTCPTVVDHMLRIRAAWKKSKVCGVESNALARRVFDFANSSGASRNAGSVLVCRTAIRQQELSSSGDLLTSFNSSSEELYESKNTHRP